MSRSDPWAQQGFDVRVEHGPTGGARLATGCAVLVVVDVLSFTTAVSAAVSRGSAVHPAPWRDDRAGALASSLGAELAVGRREATPQRPWSLSPAALLAAPVADRLVLPSPNGSTIAATTDGPVVTACLRDATAVGCWLLDAGVGPVGVVAAGERWPDGSLRPALEDVLGAGAVVAVLAAAGLGLSAEARAVADLHAATGSVPDAVRACASGIELVSSGFSADVEAAVEVDASDRVAVRGPDGFFRVG